MLSELPATCTPVDESITWRQPTKRAESRIGGKYGRLTIIEIVARKPNGTVHVRCCCDCGREKVVILANAVNGRTRSCGCLKAESAAKRDHSYRRPAPTVVQNAPAGLCGDPRQHAAHHWYRDRARLFCGGVA